MNSGVGMIEQLKRAVAVILLAAGVAVAAPVLAASKSSFMTADVVAVDYSKLALNKALTAALAQVLVRISGNPAVMTLPQVQNHVQHINNLVASYSYQSEMNDQGQSELHLQVAFIDHAVKQLLRASGQPIWSAARPVTLVWLQLQNPQGQWGTVASDNQHVAPLALALDQDANARGLSLMYPMMDLDDQANLAGVHLSQGLNVTQLQHMSLRYHVSSMLSGVARDIGGQWQADWLYILDGAPIHWQDEAASVQELANRAIDNLSSTMVSQLAMTSPEQGDAAITLHITGVGDLSQYAMVQEYLQSLAPVNKVSLEAVNADELVLNIRFQGQLGQLKQALMTGHRLTPNRSDWLQQDNSPSLAYRWVRGNG